MDSDDSSAEEQFWPDTFDSEWNTRTCAVGNIAFGFWSIFVVLRNILASNPHACFMFFGNSPSYWWLMLRIFRKGEYQGRIRLIQASISSYREVNLSPTVERQLCKQLLPNAKADAAWVAPYQRIYVIDFVKNGDSLNFFSRAVQACFPNKQVIPFVLESAYGDATGQKGGVAASTALPERHDAERLFMSLYSRHWPRMTEVRTPNSWGQPQKPPLALKQLLPKMFGLQTRKAEPAAVCASYLLKYYEECWHPIEKLLRDAPYTMQTFNKIRTTFNQAGSFDAEDWMAHQRENKQSVKAILTVLHLMFKGRASGDFIQIADPATQTYSGYNKRLHVKTEPLVPLHASSPHRPSRSRSPRPQQRR